MDKIVENLSEYLLKSGCLKINQHPINRRENSEKLENPHLDVDFSVIIDNVQLQEDIGIRYADWIKKKFFGKISFDSISGIPTSGSVMAQEVRRLLNKKWDMNKSLTLYKYIF